jgi:hypothetical protein
MPIPLMVAGAAIGAAAGLFSTWSGSREEQKRLRQQKALEQEAYALQKAYQDNTYSLQKNESLRGLGVQQNRLAQAMGADLGAYNRGLEGQALGNMDARISLSDSAGMALAQQGMSGVRGSDTLERRIAYQENAFDRGMELQGRENSAALQNMTRQYSYRFDDLGREMDSWEEGGYRHTAKAVSDLYGYQTHQLKMKGYDQAIAGAEAGVLDYLSGMLGGAAQGAAFGRQVGQMVQQWPGSEAAAPVTGAQDYQTNYSNPLGINFASFFDPQNVFLTPAPAATPLPNYIPGSGPSSLFSIPGFSGAGSRPGVSLYPGGFNWSL